MIDAIEGIMIMVSDQQKALDFYTRKLGFEKKLDTDVSGYRWIIVGPTNSKTVFSLVDPINMGNLSNEDIKHAKKKIGSPTGVWFYTKEIQTTYKDLKSKDVKITKPEKQIWGGIMSTIYDQDENSFH